MDLINRYISIYLSDTHGRYSHSIVHSPEEEELPAFKEGNFPEAFKFEFEFIFELALVFRLVELATLGERSSCSFIIFKVSTGSDVDLL